MLCRLLLLCCLTAAISAEELRLARIFQDHMVLQCDLRLPIWGWAEPGSVVSVTLAEHSASATAAADGRWQVDFAALPASAEAITLSVTCADTTLVRKDILVGEVWLCTGQSNMARDLKTEAAQNPQLAARIGERDLPQVRFLRFGPAPTDTPRDDLDPLVQGAAAWTVCTGTNAMDSMASPFFFARRLQAELGVPIGLVQVAVSGTTQTAWCAPAVLDACAAANAQDPYSFAEAFTRAEAALLRNKSAFPTWKAFADADRAWRTDPKGARPQDGSISNFPSVLYHSQIHPLAPFAFRGALWNQGEAGPSQAYAGRLHAMVTQWRQHFGHDFHFLFSSLGRNTSAAPPSQACAVTFYRSAVNAQLGEAQDAFADTGTWVDIADLGNTDTHWARKHTAGERYADATLDRVYGKARVFSGPLLDEVEHVPGRIRLRFARSGGGLVYTPSIDGISGFVLQTDHGETWIAPTTVESDTLIFSDERITADARLAYGYHPNPHETLHNREGFPASMFRLGALTLRSRDDGIPLLRLRSQTKAKLHIAEVRAQTVVVAAAQMRGEGAVEAQFTLPTNWSGLRLIHDDRDEQVAVTADADGRRSATLRLVINETAMVLCDSAAGTDAIQAARISATERF